MKDKTNRIIVCNDRCHDPSLPTYFTVGGKFWYEWLETATSFRYEGNNGGMSVFRENRSGYWVASKKVNGELRRKRLGASHEVSAMRLIEANNLLCSDALWKNRNEAPGQAVKEDLRVKTNEYKLKAIKEIVFRYKQDAKDTRDWTKANLILAEIQRMLDTN